MTMESDVPVQEIGWSQGRSRGASEKQVGRIDIGRPRSERYGSCSVLATVDHRRLYRNVPGTQIVFGTNKASKRHPDIQCHQENHRRHKTPYIIGSVDYFADLGRLGDRLETCHLQ
ncbi:hypothetical protein TNCV_1566681 [Trichonephila clavipes]|nr:hypothetical protein TNCV_1566681 [Trichonephila clavipes]